MATKSVRPANNVSAEVFVDAILRHANRADGSIETLASELGLTVNSAYARYAKYRKEMKAATGTELPKLPKSAVRKATLDWSKLAALVEPTATVDDSTEESEPEMVDMTEEEFAEINV